MVKGSQEHRGRFHWYLFQVLNAFICTVGENIIATIKMGND